MTNRDPRWEWTRAEEFGGPPRGESPAAEREGEDIREDRHSSRPSIDPFESGDESMGPLSRAGLVSVLRRTFAAPRSPAAEHAGASDHGPTGTALAAPSAVPSIRLDEPTGVEALRGIGGPSFPTERDAEEVPDRPPLEEGTSPDREVDRHGGSIGLVGSTGASHPPEFEGPSLLKGDLEADKPDRTTSISGPDRSEARVTTAFPAESRPWPIVLDDGLEVASGSSEGVDPAWAPTTDPTDWSSSARAGMDLMGRATDVSVDSGDAWKGPALVSAAWSTSPGPPDRARLTVPAPTEVGWRIAGEGPSSGSNAFGPADEGLGSGPGPRESFGHGAVDRTGPSGAPEAHAPDLTRTNELLQQLLDEVRRGRVSYLPVQDRGHRSVD